MFVKMCNDHMCVSFKVFSECGQPKLTGRRKRENFEYDEYAYGGNWKYVPKSKSVRPTTAAGTSLDRLVKDIRERVRTTKDFWILVPQKVCNNTKIAAQQKTDNDCWNGQDRAR